MRSLLDRSLIRLARWMSDARGDGRATLLLFLLGLLLLGHDRWRRSVAGLGEERSTARRFVLLILAVAALGASENAGHRFGDHYWLYEGVLMAALLAGGLAILAAVLAPPYDLTLFRRSPRLIVGVAAVCSVVLAGQSVTQIGGLVDKIRLLPQHTQFGNDAATMSSCATHLLLSGHNPYTAANIISCMWDHGYYSNGSLTTPLQQGAFKAITTYPTKASLNNQLRWVGLHKIARPLEFEAQICYPAGSFLFPTLAALLGIDDLRLFFVLCFLGAYLFILACAPRRLWPWVILIAFLNMTVWANAVAGASDALYIALVLVGWSLRRSAVPSSIALGLAATARQQSWFFLLFFAVLVVREDGWAELWRRGRIIGGIFLVTNLPFIVLSPSAWISGVLSPVVDPMFPLGSGLIALALGASDNLPLAPRGAFAVLEAVAMIACLAGYVKLCRRWPHLALVLAVVPLFFAWRSLFSYFYPVTIPVLAALVEASTKPRTTSLRARAPAPRHRPMAIRGTGASLNLSA